MQYNPELTVTFPKNILLTSILKPKYFSGLVNIWMQWLVEEPFEMETERTRTSMT